MRIHTQNLLAIVPLFLFLALVGGALLDRAAREQLRWDAAEEGSSLAVATAEFLAAGPGEIPRAPLERILHAGQARRFVVLSPDRARVLLALPAAPSGDPDRITTWATIPGGRGILGVETDGRRLRVAEARIHRQALWIGAITVLLGIAVALGLSSGITREVQALTRAAQTIGAEDRRLETPRGRIREIADLGGTFQTMQALLGEIQTRAQRAQTDAPETPPSDALARRYRQIYPHPLGAALAGVRLQAGTLGDDLAGFHAAAPLPDGGACALVGRLRPGVDPLETAADAAAVRAYLTRLLPRYGVETSLARATTHFPLERLRIVSWAAGAGDAHHWEIAEPTRTIPFPVGGRLALAVLADTDEEALQRYGDRFPQLSPQELLADLPAVLPQGAAGSVVVLQREIDCLEEAAG